MKIPDRVIEKSYLTELIAKCGVLFTIGLLLTGVILYYTSHQPLGPSYQDSFARLSQLKQEMLLKSIYIYCILMFLTIAGVVFTTVIYSHRVVGPMVGLNRITKQITAGDFTSRITLRKNDAIKPMASALNEMAQSYQNKILSIQAVSKDLKGLCQEPTSPDQAEKLVKKSAELQKIFANIEL